MSREHDIQELKKHRQEHFEASVGEDDTFRLFEGEFYLSITYNGTHWTSLSIAPHELNRIIELLRSKKRQLKEKGLIK